MLRALHQHVEQCINLRCQQINLQTNEGVMELRTIESLVLVEPIGVAELVKGCLRRQSTPENPLADNSDHLCFHVDTCRHFAPESCLKPFKSKSISLCHTRKHCNCILCWEVTVRNFIHDAEETLSI